MAEKFAPPSPQDSGSVEQLFRVLDQVASAYILLDSQQRVQRFSESYLQLFPWQSKLLTKDTHLARLLESEPESSLTAWSQAQLNGLRHAHLQMLAPEAPPADLSLPSGRHLSLAATPLADGQLLITYRDLPSSRNSVAELEQLAFLDPLTHLPNRRLLLDRLSQAMLQSQRTGWLGALLFLDLEQLRPLAQSMGRATTDQLIRHIGQRLMGCVRASDTVARLGNEEFVVMVSDLAPDAAVAATLVQRIGDKLLSCLETPYVVGEHTHHVATSIGATLFGPYSHSSTELLRQAEIAMYQLRERSGSGLCFFDPQLQMEVHQRVRMETDLRQALADSQFEMHYQPQFAESGDVIGLEALLRWRHPTKGLVPPSMFIAVAEESDIILPLGRWALHAACAQLALWHKQSHPQLAAVPMSVNVSAKQFQQPNFVEQLIQILAETGIEPALLTLELPEVLLHNEAVGCKTILQKLTTLGVRVALDNFGAGQAALSTLTQLPLHQLKISQSLVQRLGPSNSSEAAVQAVIDIADTLGLQVVAEGVETLEQRALLEQYGCQRFQGYLYSAPVSVEQLELLTAQPSQSSRQMLPA